MSRLLRCQLGDELPIVTLPPVSRLDLIKYAGASGFARLNMDQIFTISNEEIQFTGFIKLPAISLQ